MTHLSTLELRLSNERARLANAKTDQERQLRIVWVAQIKKEISGEHRFAVTRSIANEETRDNGYDNLIAEMSDDELLVALNA